MGEKDRGAEHLTRQTEMGNAKAYKSKETKLHGMPQRWVGVRRAAHDTGRDGACYGIGDGECKAEWDKSSR